MKWIAKRLRRFADLIDRHGAPKATGLSFTMEPGIGRVLHYGEGIHASPPPTGCRLWMLNDDDYAKAYSDAGKRRPDDSTVVLRPQPRIRVSGLPTLDAEAVVRMVRESGKGGRR